MIVRAGMWQSLERGTPLTYLTLTAAPMWRPGTPASRRRTHRLHSAYWKLIRGRKRPSRKALNEARRRAICGPCTKQVRAKAKAQGRKVRKVPPVIHSPEDPLAGIPFDLDAFDYDAATAWNWDTGERWNRTVLYAQRDFGVAVDRIKVRELQRRGVLHIHAIIEGEISQQQLNTLISRVNASYGDRGQGWGAVSDVQVIRPDPKLDGREIGRITAYVAKYVTKSTAIGIGIAADGSPHANAHLARLRAAAYRVAAQRAHIRPFGPCRQPGCDGTLRPVGSGDVRCGTCQWEGRHRLLTYAQRLGVRSQPMTKSRHWAHEHRESRVQPGRWIPVFARDCSPKPLTFRALRRNRARYAASTHPKTSPPKWRWAGPANPNPWQLPRPHLRSPIQPHAPPPELPDPY